MSYEIEIRFRFSNMQEVWDCLPMLSSLEWKDEIWQTIILSKRLFDTGELLRVSTINPFRDAKYYLGWKGKDIGNFANVREELGENITNGINESVILSKVGLDKLSHKTCGDLISYLEFAGHGKFLEFNGENKVAVDLKTNSSFKIMNCSQIQYPVMLEIEKTTDKVEQISFYENSLLEFTQEYNLLNRVVHEEPPTLLYNFKHH